MRLRSVALCVLLLAATAHAQVTIQHGNTLSELINNLYGGNGFDTLDYSGYGAVITVNLQTNSATTGATGGVAFFDSILGSSASGNTLRSPVLTRCGARDPKR